MAIYRYTFYKTPNIGIFVKANDSILLVPHGFAVTKTSKLLEYLKTRQIYASIAGTRLLGPMTVMNNNGILLPAIASDDEVEHLKQASKLNVERISSRYTAIGNLIATNDNGALVSPVFQGEADKQIQDVLGVPTHSMGVGGYVQTGAMVVATNGGAGVHPKATEEEVQAISEALHVPAEPVTVNDGVPFLTSGIVANTQAVVVGSQTSGPELIMLSRIFKA